MKAVRIHRFGGPEVLVYEDAPTPTCDENDVLIRVYAAGVNPIDVKIRKGTHPLSAGPLPRIPGWDVSGIVNAVGPGVSRFKPGDAVFARTNFARAGSYAEYIIVDASEIAFKPESIDHIQAAAVPLVGLTAWQSLFDCADLRGGQRILVHAAAGGVGSIAVQLAKWKGAFVIGTASASNHAFLKSIGVDHCIDYNTTPFEDVVHDVDVVYDLIGADTRTRSWQTLRPGGTLVSIVRPVPDTDLAAQHRVKSHRIVCRPNGSQLAQMAGLVDEGHIRPVVQTVLPLAEASQAHALIETGHTRGKIVLSVFS